MPLSLNLSRALPFGKSKNPEPGSPNFRPPLARSQATASSLQRSIQRNPFLSGRQPPKAQSPLTPDEISILTRILSLPVSTPLLTTTIASLKPPLGRLTDTLPAIGICDVHSWLEVKWIEELATIIGKELGPRLDHLRDAPPELRSSETDSILDILTLYTHLLPFESAETERRGQCAEDCMVCNFTSCKACRLSQLFQSKNAIRALNASVKGRKKKDRPWPEACAWLDPLPGSGWEMRWRKEGLVIIGDRTIAREFRKSGGQENFEAKMASIRAGTLAAQNAVRQMEEEELWGSTQSRQPTENSAYKNIIERNWSVGQETMKNPETSNLRAEDGAENDTDAVRRRADSFNMAYDKLVGTNSRQHDRASFQSEETKEQTNRGRRTSEVSWEDDSQWSTESRASDQSLTCSEEVRKSSFSSEKPSHTPGTDTPKESMRESRNDGDRQSWAAMYKELVGTMSPTEPNASIDGDQPDWRTSKASAITRPESAVRPSGRSRARSAFPIESWAVFNNSPLGKGRQTQTLDFLDPAGEKRVSRD